MAKRGVIIGLALATTWCATTSPGSKSRNSAEAPQGDGGAVAHTPAPEPPSLLDDPIAKSTRETRSYQALIDPSGPRLVLIHRNDVGRGYVLQNVEYALDTVTLFSRTAKEFELDSGLPVTIFDAHIAPGEHDLVARLDYRGALLSLSIGYRFQIRGTYRIDAKPGKTTIVTAIGCEEREPKIRYEVSTRDEPTERSDAGPRTGTPR